jgi:phosphohistidine swiveling domain-containing protein
MTDWTPPAPGPWQQDSAHTPKSQTLILRELYPDGFNRGFTETFARYGLLLDRLAMAEVNGFTYHQPQPFDMPGPDGPKSPEQLHAEFGRRAALAEESFESKRWRGDLALWDDTCKPASISRQLELERVDVGTIEDGALASYLDEVGAHLSEMVYQHHRFNLAAMLPVGDMALRGAAWTGLPPTAMLAVLDGYSPISALVSSEMGDALDAIRADTQAIGLCSGDGDTAERLAQLRDRLPAVDAYVRLVQDRPIDGFDVVSPTLREQAVLVLGKLAGALDADAAASRNRADAAAAELREQVPTEHQEAFDELVAEARLVYRLRDERGLYSEVPAIGLLRRALLAIGNRARERGQVEQADHLLDATLSEAKAILNGDGPSSVELAERGETRRRLTAEGPPRYLGPPPPPPPPIDELPPALGRMMGAVGFMIDSILGQLDESVGEASVIGGIGVTDQVAEGTARIIRDIGDLLDIEPGEIIVASSTGEAFNSVLHLVSGIVTDHGSHLCHSAIVAREMGIPAVVGTVNASRRIKQGDRIRVDGSRGEILVL